MAEQWKDANGNEMKMWQSRWKTKISIDHKIGNSFNHVQLDFTDHETLTEIGNAFLRAAYEMEDLTRGNPQR